MNGFKLLEITLLYSAILIAACLLTFVLDLIYQDGKEQVTILKILAFWSMVNLATMIALIYKRNHL